MINDYYTVYSEEKNIPEAVFGIRLNPDCDVYRGHFPGSPISPGVCNIQMIKECAERMLGRKLFFKALPVCRFKVLISPSTHPELTVRLMLEDEKKLSAKILDKDTVCLEMKTEFEYER